MMTNLRIFIHRPTNANNEVKVNNHTMLSIAALLSTNTCNFSLRVFPSSLISAAARRIHHQFFFRCQHKLLSTTATPTAATPSTSTSTTAQQGKKVGKTQQLGTLRVSGPDDAGLIAACTQVLNHHACNILRTEQWTDTRENMFFQRICFHYNDGYDNNYDDDAVDKIGCEQDLKDLFHNKYNNNIKNKSSSPTTTMTTNTLKATWNWRERRKKIGILVSKYDHCLWELLLRHKAEELDADISVVISNHDTLQSVVTDTFGIPFHVTSITKSSNNNNKSHTSATSTTTTKHQQPNQHEEEQLELLKGVDVVILARYMQVLSSNFLHQFPPDGIINIHHSFLPAFVGGSPHRQAHDRGVKLIGATAHYTTEILDEGPIIEQDVIACSHRDSVEQLVKKGRVLERNVLLKAIEAHLDDRIILHGNRCVVFGD